MNSQEVQFAVVKGKDSNIKEIGKSFMLQPKIKFNGGSTKWFDDSKLLKKDHQQNDNR